jgi:hypothetical protein
MDKEELLFQMLKDNTKTSTDIKRGELQKKYPDINISDLHKRIINYQVKKYGISLNSHNQNKIEAGLKIAKLKNIKRNRKNGK